ncbi:MAG: HD domain-containing protein [Prevotellaceae bacterium]|nr:HD domain-containing protein [Prevotellaceae bacterium]MDO4931633.1 HD domain-containing protein [Prevotellaceae bacterium]
MENHISLDLMEFIERNILPRYAAFDAAHNMEHVMRVIKMSNVLARKMGADVNMAYVVAAYHDLGLDGPRAVHHITSGKILKADKRLERWFTQQQINTMVQAVEDHRASASRAPRSIYGRIVAEADRDLLPDTVFRRTVLFGLEHYPEMSDEEHWQRFREHIMQKYSVSGYIHLWIQGSENERNLKELRCIIADEVLLRRHFDEIYKEYKKSEF